MYKQQRHEHFARKVMKRPGHLSAKTQKRLLELRLCNEHPKQALKLVRRLRERRSLHRRNLIVQRSLTPYHCGSHGWFAIPCPIIACESGFNWNAHNPSGADGVYQLLPGVGPDHAAQHRAAAAKWAGGAGRSQWVC